MNNIADGKVLDNLQAKERAEALDQDYEESLTDYDSDYDDLLEELEDLSASYKKWKKKQKKREKKLQKRYEEGLQSIVSRLDHLEQFNKEMSALLERAFQTSAIPLRSDSRVGVPITELLNRLLICADRQRVDTTRLSLDYFRQSLPEDEYLNWEVDCDDRTGTDPTLRV